MNTLRVKLIVLLAAAILIVVGLATWIFFLMLDRPNFAGLGDANAAQIALLMRHAEGKDAGGPDAPGLGLRSAPAGGERLAGFTADLRAALARKGIVADAVVTRPQGSRWPVVSVPMPGGSDVLVAPVVPPPQPPDILRPLIGWMLLIAGGATLIAVAAVYRLTQPLSLVERSIATIDPDGELQLPEVGPAELRATARAINLLSARLKNAMESRMRLVAAAGHDLRTPMTRMRLRAEFLTDPDRDKWLADLDELDHIADSAISLVREEMVVGDGQPLQLDALLRDLVGELGEMGLDLRLGAIEPTEVSVKPLSLKRALRNLMVNAATHGRGASVRLRRQGGMALIEIADRGPGIPEHLLQRALEPFFRVDPARTSGGGAGLGLAIAREIITRHRGHLTLANAPSGGLVQTITLPLGVHVASPRAALAGLGSLHA
jgi:signal transduction histidine kinase